MTSKYSDLRIERWKNRASAAVAGAAALSLAENASAAAVALPQTIAAGGAKWYLSNTTDAFSGPSGLGITEATLVGPPVRNDAYDGAFILRVNGVNFQDPTGTVDLTGTTLTSNAAVMSGLNVTEQFFFDPASPTVRQVVSFQNPSGAPVTATISWEHNLGSDNATTVFTSSSGDTVVTPADRTFISWDGSPTGDPTLTFAAFGLGASVTPSATTQAPGSGVGNFADQFSITVPAGQTRRLMFFGRLSQSNAAAQTAITTFDSTANLQAAGLLAGLSAQQQSEIVNWSIAALPGTPIPGTFTLMLTGLVLVAAGIKAKSWLTGFRQA